MFFLMFDISKGSRLHYLCSMISHFFAFYYAVQHIKIKLFPVKPLLVNWAGAGEGGLSSMSAYMYTPTEILSVRC